MHFIQIRQQRKNSLVTQRHINDPMMRKRTHRSKAGTLLPTTQRSRRHKQTRIFTPIAARSPDSAGTVPECFPLCGEVAVACWDAEEDGAVVLEGVDCCDWVVGFGRCVHLGENFL